MLSAPEGKALVASAVTALAVGTVVYTILEGWTLLDSLYFSVVTLATVGFGDLHPTTDPAKLFTIFYIVTGFGILAAFVSELTKTRQVLMTGQRLRSASATVEQVERDVAEVSERIGGAVEGEHDGPRADR
jgi:hypothetical protein